MKIHGSFLKIGLHFLFGFEIATTVRMTRSFNIRQLAFKSNNHLPHTLVVTRDCEAR